MNCSHYPNPAETSYYGRNELDVSQFSKGNWCPGMFEARRGGQNSSKLMLRRVFFQSKI